MGEVYRASDSRLNRTVAIKVLSPELAAHPLFRERFDREAKTLATLSHPHICPVFDVGEQDGIDFLVMEYLEGPTLGDRLANGPMPLDEALRIARQIAEALESAHARGIIHRDLKPANIKITRDAGAKVLDFGLAKLAAGDGNSPDLSQLPTETRGGTRLGVILGTAAYMSPEQARGQAVDKRTDIWLSDASSTKC